MASQQSVSLPELPYPGLMPFGIEHASLLAGRKADTERCSRLLGDGSNRIFILHGLSGCGKSSFLRAALIPYLRRNLAFDFMQKNAATVFVRATHDPLVRLAFSLFEFSLQPLEIKSPDGNVVKINLNDDLSAVFNENISADSLQSNGRHRVEEFAAFVGTDVDMMRQSLSRICRRLPKTLVIIIDQCEEVLTIRPGSDGEKYRERFFALLRSLMNVPVDIRVILSLRTEFLGRLHHRLSDAGISAQLLHNYYLDVLNRANLIDAIERPTSDFAYHKYRFKFEDKLPAKIVDDLLQKTPPGGVLPALQIVCSRLYKEIKDQQEATIREDHYKNCNGVVGLITTYMDETLDQILSRKTSGRTERLKKRNNWKKLLLELVQLQTDGTVTTRLVPDSDLRQRALSLRIKDAEYENVLGKLCDENTRMCKKMSILTVFDKDTARRELICYSLVHDALGLMIGSSFKQPILSQAIAYREVVTIIKRSKVERHDEDDPQKGRWGGRSQSNGWTLDAAVTSLVEDDDLFNIHLKVSCGDSAPKANFVVFHLHPTFTRAKRTVKIDNGLARLNLNAWGAFTVGAELDTGIRLELDLSKLPDAPKVFTSR